MAKKKAPKKITAKKRLKKPKPLKKKRRLAKKSTVSRSKKTVASSKGSKHTRHLSLKKSERRKDTNLPKDTSAPSRHTFAEDVDTVMVTAASPAIVSVTYELNKTGDVSIDRIHFGLTVVDLEEDQDSQDANKFLTKGDKTYDVLTDSNGQIKVRVSADGNSGGGWSMSLKINGAPMAEDPIEVAVNESGRADHNQLHS